MASQPIRPMGVQLAEAILAEQRDADARAIAEVQDSYVNRIDAMIAETERRAERVPSMVRRLIDGYAREVVDGVRCDSAHPEQCCEAGAQAEHLFFVGQGRWPNRDERCAINRAVLRAWEERATLGVHERAAQRDARRENWS